MKTIVLLAATVVLVIAICNITGVNSLPQHNYGKYESKEKNLNDGNYRKTDDGQYHPNPQREGHSSGAYDPAGQYMHHVIPYRHVHDNRELGFYVHIPNPYDGGYGPYAGLNIAYQHDGRPYMHDDKPYDHNLYTTTTTTTTPKPTTTTKRTTTTTTTTTTTPRSILFNYDDEGRHKILHQEEIRKHDKYDHNYLTENGIYGEEKAKLHHEGGTHAEGYYEYTGDDGKLYRVNYSSSNKGFIPTGDHIPTPPPIPEAIARALKYVEEKHKANGNVPKYDHRGFPINDMPKDLMAKIKAIHMEDLPKDLVPKVMELKREMEQMEREYEIEMAKRREMEKQNQNLNKNDDDDEYVTTIGYQDV